MNVRVRCSLAITLVALTACTTSPSDGRPLRDTTAPHASASNAAPSASQGASTAPSEAATQPQAGAAGAGDPYFPNQGNGGYDVDHYVLTIDYTPAGHRLDGTANLRAHATQALSRFNLDLRPTLRATSVRVNGSPAKAEQPSAQEQELVITPATPIDAGSSFVVEVSYSGVGEELSDGGMRSGWIPTEDGAFVAGEPQGAATWFPVNDTPTDKATYDVTITVPNGLAAISNGVLVGRSTSDGRTTWRWALRQRVQSYLITATVGRFKVSTGTTSGGLPFVTAVDPAVATEAAPVLRKLSPILAYFTSVYGPYPFGAAGAIVDNAPQVGYALETATRPLFDRAPDEFTFAHELAHQWYGDDVTLQRWRDIWLNEGFAQFSSWLWYEHVGIRSGRSFLDALMSEGPDSSNWNPPPGNPGQADAVFSASVYNRGGGALQALREKLGDRVFFTIMRGWVVQHSYGNATVEQFTAFAQQISRRDLKHFFDVWLYRPGKPDQRVP